MDCEFNRIEEFDGFAPDVITSRYPTFFIHSFDVLLPNTKSDIPFVFSIPKYLLTPFFAKSQSISKTFVSSSSEKQVAILQAIVVFPSFISALVISIIFVFLFIPR